MVTKTESAEAHVSLIDQEKNQTQIVQAEKNPIELADYIFVNDYDYSNQKKVNEIMASYTKEVEAEKKAKEEERKKEESKKSKVVVASYKQYTDTRSDFNELYERAGKAFGIHPKLLQAVHMVETGGRGNTTVSSYAGAQGPMQFMPATFRAYGVDGNGDGVAEINNVDDAVFSAAKYLAANGGASDPRKGLWHYNHSSAYVEKVMGIAHSLGM